MTNSSIFTLPDFLGFYELDTQGCVLYSRPKRAGEFDKPDSSIIGRNFFSEVLNFRNVAEFRRRFGNFVNGNYPTENFTFNCLMPDDNVAVKVMFVRVAENYGAGNERLVYVEIRGGLSENV